MTLYNRGAAAVANIGTLKLDAPGWTGNSSIAKGIIGNGLFNVLGGGLTVVQAASGAGGEVNSLTIHADIIGPIDIPVLRKLHITGGGLKSANITVSDKIAGFGLTGLTIAGNVFGNISIADIASGAVTLGTTTFPTDFQGTLDLLNGVPQGRVTINTNVNSASVIDLHNKDVAGTLECLAANHGDITYGGAVTGTVTLAGGAGNTFSGTATFTSVAGTVKTVSGAAVSGNIDITENLTGSVDIDDDLSGVVHVSEDLSGVVSVGGALSGSIMIDGNASGDINMESLSGSVSIGADLSADVILGGDLTSSGSVTVGGALAGVGRILTAITKECAGSISVGKQTDDLTLIHCNDGLTSTGTIEINTSRGDFDAGGTIRVGLEYVPFPLPEITYDGCIRIYDQDPGIGGGILTGTISVVGCHNPGPLNICIDRRNLGTIDIVQTDCPNQVGWSCGGCP